LPELKALPERMSPSSCSPVGEECRLWIRLWYHFHSSTHWSGTSAVPSSAMMLPAPKLVPWALGAAVRWCVYPHCWMLDGSKSGLVASLPLASTVRICDSSSTLAQSQSPSHSVPTPYGSPYSAGGYGRPASSNSSLL